MALGKKKLNPRFEKKMETEWEKTEIAGGKNKLAPSEIENRGASVGQGQADCALIGSSGRRTGIDRGWASRSLVGPDRLAAHGAVRFVLEMLVDAILVKPASPKSQCGAWTQWSPSDKDSHVLARKPTERIADFVVHQAYLALRVVVIHECLELFGCELLLRRKRVHRTLPQPLHSGQRFAVSG